MTVGSTLNLIRHYSTPRGPRTLQPSAMGQCLEGRPAFPKDDASYVEALESTARSVPTASDLAVLAHCWRCQLLAD
jgi:hypothetical protein